MSDAQVADTSRYNTDNIWLDDPVSLLSGVATGLSSLPQDSANTTSMDRTPTQKSSISRTIVPL